MGDIEDDGGKPKYAKLRKGQTLESIDLKTAIDLFSLPRTVGQFENKDVIVSEGRYGPYIRFDNGFISLKDLDPFTVDLSSCIELINNKREFEKKKIINSFDNGDSLIEVCNGRYGPYIKFENKNYKIPKKIEPQNLTKEDCLNLIEKTIKK